MRKTWFITGAGRGFGADIARAALHAGDNVVAAGRDAAAVRAVLGAAGRRLLAVTLDVEDERQAMAAVDAAVARFGTIDVLVNDAVAAAQGRFGSDLFGVFNVTRVVLPLMRAARGGRIFNVASGSLALEGFSASLAREVAPFGIRVVLVDPAQPGDDVVQGDSEPIAAAWQAPGSGQASHQGHEACT